jgi:hypothetical protein
VPYRAHIGIPHHAALAMAAPHALGRAWRSGRGSMCGTAHAPMSTTIEQKSLLVPEIARHIDLWMREVSGQLLEAE